MRFLVLLGQQRSFKYYEVSKLSGVGHSAYSKSNLQTYDVVFSIRGKSNVITRGIVDILHVWNVCALPATLSVVKRELLTRTALQGCSSFFGALTLPDFH